MIPKIIKYNICPNTTNMVKNFIDDYTYYISPNEFSLNHIKIGPFSSSKELDVQIFDFTKSKHRFDFLNGKVEKENDGEYYYLLVSFILN